MSYQTGNQQNQGTVVGTTGSQQLAQQLASGNLNPEEQAACQRAKDAIDAAVATGRTVVCNASGNFIAGSGHENLMVNVG